MRGSALIWAAGCAAAGSTAAAADGAWAAQATRGSFGKLAEMATNIVRKPAATLRAKSVVVLDLR